MAAGREMSVRILVPDSRQVNLLPLASLDTRHNNHPSDGKTGVRLLEFHVLQTGDIFRGRLYTCRIKRVRRCLRPPEQR